MLTDSHFDSEFKGRTQALGWKISVRLEMSFGHIKYRTYAISTSARDSRARAQMTTSGMKVTVVPLALPKEVGAR